MKTKSDWEDRIEKLLIGFYEEKSIPLAYARIVGIKDRIHQLLQQARREGIEEAVKSIEAKKVPVEDVKKADELYQANYEGFNEGLSVAQEILDVLKKKK